MIIVEPFEMEDTTMEAITILTSAMLIAGLLLLVYDRM
jgi:hypothetical protein